MEGKVNTKTLFFGWWYGEAFGRLLSFIKHFYAYIFDLFSVKISLRTLFAPWKRDQIYYENLSLQQQLQVWLLNLTSRFVGFWVKAFTIFTCLIVEAAFTLFACFAIVFWLAYPLILAILVIVGFKLIFGA